MNANQIFKWLTNPRFAPKGRVDVVARFTEVEIGRKSDRPELMRAIHLAKVTGATLIIAKLDRLSRNAAFLLTLRDSGVRFLACNVPEADDVTVGIMALVAEASLRRAGKGGVALRATVAANAQAHAADHAAVVADIRASGATSLRAIATELNRRGMLTRRGGKWQVSHVRNLLGRLGSATRRSAA